MELQREYLRDARRKMRERRDYFDDHEDDELLAETPASASSAQQQEDEVDPLDAFMQGIEAQVQSAPAKTPADKVGAQTCCQS